MMSAAKKFIDDVEGIINKEDINQGFILLKDGGCIKCSSEEASSVITDLSKLEFAYRKANGLLEVYIRFEDLTNMKRIMELIEKVCAECVHNKH